MTLKSEVDQLFLAQLESGNIRYTTAPVAAAPVAVVSDGVVAAWAWAPYIEIVAAAVIPAPCWLAGVTMHTVAVESHTADLAIASGAVAAEVDLAMVHYSGVWPVVGVTAALIANAVARLVDSFTIWLPYPIRIATSVRLAGRVRKSTGVSAAGISVKCILASAVGS